MLLAAALAWPLASATLPDTLTLDGMAVLHDSQREGDSHAVPVRPVGDGPVAETEHGTVRWRSFRGHMPPTPLAAVEAAQTLLALSGVTPVLDCATAACGGFAFRAAIDLLPMPAMAMNPADFHQRTLRGLDDQGRPLTVSLLGSRFGGQTYLQVVTVTSAAAAPAPAPARQAVPPEPTEPDPASPARQLAESGRIRLPDIDVDPAGAPTAAALAESPTLDAVAALMRDNPTLNLVAVGHSDGVGALAANISLSRRRAEAVVEALVARGVPRTRLSVEGAGWLSPVASNATEAGRAANRRIELIQR